MSLHSQQFTLPVADDTARIARASFRRGNPYLLLRDQLGAVFDDAGFADLYPKRGQPAYAPWRLALVTATGRRCDRALLAPRFAIETFARALGPWYEECVAMHGLRERCAGILCLDSPFTSADDIAEQKEVLLVDLAHRAIRERDADAVILAGAPLTGLARKVADRIPVPVIDQVAAAVKQAEALAALGLRKATGGTFRRPEPKSTGGLPRALADRVEHRIRE